MKPINKEDMPKLIVLIVLAVGIFGFALVQFISSSSPSVAATPASDSKAAKSTDVASATGSAQTAATELPAEPELDFLHVGPPTGGKDPFIPNGSAALTPANSTAPVKVAVARPLPVKVTEAAAFNYVEALPSAGKSVTTVRELPRTSKPLSPEVVELPAPSWQVAGIVLAEQDTDGIKRGRDVAILRDGAGSRRFVTVGDPVNNGYVVSAVLPGGVEIRNKKRTTLINLDSSSLNLSERPGGTTTGSKENNGATTRAN